MVEFHPFPNTIVPDSEKEKPEYGLQWGKAIEYEWFRRPSGATAMYYDKRQKFHTLRLYARGEQSPEIYKKLLSKSKTSYSNYDWRPLQIIPKFVKLLTNQMAERLYELKIEATDKFSTDMRTQQKEYLQRVVACKPIYEIAKENFGIDAAPINMEELPQNNEEIELWMQMNYKQAIEIAAEEAIKYTLDYNDYDETQSRVIEDIATLGIGAVKHITDPTKGILVKYVDPSQLVYSFPRTRNFKDVYYFGEVERVTLDELKRISNGALTDAQIKEISNVSIRWMDYQTNNPGIDRNGEMSALMVDVLNFTFKTTNTITYKKKKTRTGGYNMIKKDSSFGAKGSTDGYEVVKKTIDVWYEGSLLLGTNHIFNYKKVENMIRPNGFLNQTMANYVVYAPDIYQNRTKSLVERMISYVDQMQMIHIKIQQLVAKSRPNGIYIDINGLEEVDMGNGNFLTPLELIKIYDETGNVLGTSVNSEGEYNYGKQPIQELRNGVVSGLGELISLYNHYLNLLRDAVGIPAGADASMPNPDTLVGVQQQVALNSNTATRHVLDGSLNITKMLCSGVSYRLKDIFKYSDLKEVYINAVGKIGVQVLEALQNYALYDLGVNVEIKPDAQEKSFLEQNIQMALSRDLITIIDANDIRSLSNIKLANRVLEIRMKMRERKKLEDQKAMIDANSQSQIQSAQATSQMKLQEMQMEIQGKIELERAKAEAEIAKLHEEAKLKSELMAEEFHYNMTLRGIDVEHQNKMEQFRFNQKKDLQNKRDSNASAIAFQKKFGQQPLNFESSEDNLSGTMDMNEMNPS